LYEVVFVWDSMPHNFFVLDSSCVKPIPKAQQGN